MKCYLHAENKTVFSVTTEEAMPGGLETDDTNVLADLRFDWAFISNPDHWD